MRKGCFGNYKETYYCEQRCLDNTRCYLATFRERIQRLEQKQKHRPVQKTSSALPLKITLTPAEEESPPPQVSKWKAFNQLIDLGVRRKRNERQTKES